MPGKMKLTQVPSRFPSVAILTVILVASLLSTSLFLPPAGGRPLVRAGLTPLANPYGELNYSVGTAVANGTDGVAFDPTDGSFFAVTSSGYVVRLNESAWNVTGVARAPAGSYAQVAIDPIHQLGFVTGGNYGALTIFNASTMQTYRTISTGGGSGVVVDPLHELVTFSNGGALSILNYASWIYEANLTPTYSPGRMGYDPAKNLAAFVYQGGSTLGIVNDTDHRWVANVTVASGPVATAYDPASGDFVVVGTYDVTLVDPSPPFTTSNYTIPTTTCCANAVTVVNGGVDEALLWEYYNVNGGDKMQPFDISRGTFLSPAVYDDSTGYPAALASDPKTRVAVGVDSVNDRDVPFLPNVTGPDAITFSETGLPAGTDWCVTLASSNTCTMTSSLEFQEASGSYSYKVGPVAGYTPSPASGTIVASSTTVSQTIAFSGPAVVRHYANFTETGLPASTPWSVTLNWMTVTSSTATLSIQIPAGVYTYSVGKVTGYVSNPSGGYENLSAGSVAQSVSFSAAPTPHYPVTFTENGLPASTLWSVVLGGVNASSAGASIAFNETNGTYAYTVAKVGSYTPSPSSGNATVNGKPLNYTVDFSASGKGLYDVTFTESGLAAGTTWTVTLVNSTLSSALASIVFSEKNGTYDYDIGSVAYYTSSPTSGNVTVRALNQSVAITFTPSALNSVSVTPTAPTIDINATQEFKANPTCSTTCPSTINYTWSLNNSIGKLGSPYGPTANVTAGPAAGTLELRLVASLRGVTRYANVTLTIVKPPPTLSSVSISPTFIDVGVGNSTNFTAHPNCVGGPCPSGVFYQWGIEYASLGTLTSGLGPNATFTAGQTAGLEIVAADAYLNTTGPIQGIAEVNITKGPVPELKSLSLSPAPSAYLQIDHVLRINASATCNVDPCPSYTSYTWSVNNSLGTIVGSGASANFTAGASAGLVTVKLTAELNTVARVAETNLTISTTAPPSLKGLLLSASESAVQVGGTVTLSANATCSPSACPASGVTYGWVVNNSLGGLTAASGPRVQFIAGSTPGAVEITVKASYNDHSVTNETYLTVSAAPPPPQNKTSSTGFLGLPGDEGYFLLIGVAAAVIGAVVAVSVRKRKASPPEGQPAWAGPGTNDPVDPYAGYAPPPPGGYYAPPDPGAGYSRPPPPEYGQVRAPDSLYTRALIAAP